MNSLLQTLGAVAGLAAIFVALINVIATRKNRGAEVRSLDASATGALTGAASQLVKDLGDDNTRLRASNVAIEKRNDELELRIRSLEEHEHKLDVFMHQQADWILAVVKMAGESVPPFPLPQAPSDVNVWHAH